MEAEFNAPAILPVILSAIWLFGGAILQTAHADGVRTRRRMPTQEVTTFTPANALVASGATLENARAQAAPGLPV